MISAVILSHNAARTIRDAIHAVSWCSDVLILDDNSTDDTPKIAKKLGSRLISHSLNNDFAAQRNFALSLATNQWIFFVDSDEVVPKNLREEIEQRVGKEQGVNGYFVKRTDVFFGKKLLHGEQGNVKLLRLAKKNAGQWDRPVHEAWHITGKVGILENPILHYPHDNVAQFLDTINDYSTQNARYLFSKGKHVSWLEIAAYHTAKFFKDYIFLGGFLDGTEGAIAAIMMSFHSFLSRAKLWQLWDQIKTS